MTDGDGQAYLPNRFQCSDEAKTAGHEEEKVAEIRPYAEMFGKK